MADVGDDNSGKPGREILMRDRWTMTRCYRTVAVVIAFAALAGVSGQAPAAERVVLGEYFTSVY